MGFPRAGSNPARSEVSLSSHLRHHMTYSLVQIRRTTGPSVCCAGLCLLSSRVFNLNVVLSLKGATSHSPNLRDM